MGVPMSEDITLAEEIDSTVIKKSGSGKIFFAIAYEFWVKGNTWEPAFLYLHAMDAGDARLQFFASEPTKMHKRMNIVGIAPVIGYHVNDDNGDALEV